MTATPTEPERARSGVSPATWTALLAAGLAFLAIVYPQPVAPPAPPHLVLDNALVHAQFRLDEREAAAAPASNRTTRFDELFQVRNRAETGPGEVPRDITARRTAMREALEELRAAHGDKTVWGLRARATLAIAASLHSGERQPELWGTFDRSLHSHGLLLRGAPTAPELCIRTLFKTRWNVLLGRPKLDHLSPIELQAFWGWLAIEDPAASLQHRMAALDEYARAGGTGIDEARATLLFLGGRHREARAAFDTLFQKTGNLRYRNYAIASSLEPIE